ncbi:MAG TPA: tetratricopeptide repeat protein [Bryobacteraceae bacterium]|nr:tetratricopeptide repeat protein [Bryobacteraceae bacterium]
MLSICEAGLQPAAGFQPASGTAFKPVRTMHFCLTTLCLGLVIPIAVAQAPANFDDLSRRAEAALDTNPAEAATLYKQALDQQPSWPEGWLYLGGALYRLNRCGEAVDAFHKGLDLAPTKGAGWGFLGLCEYDLGHLDKALSAIAKGEQFGLGANTGFEAAVRQRAAMILIRSSQFDQAMSQLQPLSKLQENAPAIVEAVGLCALGIAAEPSSLPESRRKVVDMAGKAMWAATCQRPHDAEAGFHELLATYPDEPGVHYAYGLYLMDIDQHGALEQFQAERKKNPTHWPTLLVSAFLETRQGSPDVAMDLAARARKLAPPNYNWLCDAEEGRALLAKDEAEKAVPFLEESVKLAPGNAQTHFYLEQAYRRSGKKTEAQKEKTEFLRLKAQEDPLALPGLMNNTSR